MTDSRRPVIWSAPARTDLSDVWDYCFKASGRQTADRIVRGVVEACQLLEVHPFAGRAREEIRTGLRSIAVNPHVVFYRVREGVAEIVRVLDGRRDLDEIFGADG